MFCVRLRALCGLERDNRETGALDLSWFGQSGTAPATVIGKELNDTTVSDHGKVSVTR